METTTNIKSVIAFEDLMKLDIRVCEIINAEPVEKSNKLYKLTINTGTEERIVVSGLAKFYEADQLKGCKVPFVLNLAPRTIMGIESHGMIVAAECSDKSLSLLETKAQSGSVVF